MENADKTQLSIPEAVLLGHAMVSRVADSLGIRAFFIKGPASVIQGLRLPKISGDVDVFVAPADLDLVLQGLKERGWRERPVDPDSTAVEEHSVTVDHPEWPCCIDVHYRFPGMENDPVDVFESMWATTEDLEVAGQMVRVPSKPLGILILGLHALRSPQLPACKQELDFLSGLIQRERLAVAILSVAIATGSVAAMRPLLEGVLPQTTAVAWPEISNEWRSRLMATAPGSARMIAVALAPMRRRPQMLFRLAFPTHEGLLSRNVYADMSFCGRLRQYRARLVLFLQAAPQIARDLNKLRRHR